ncbi:Unannotated [Lentimonas sp. CC19]|nr:Unannotated [Lentimonas sp. CC19]CAA6696908.1 Unannotated [Lentimonas sp. CC10]CAA7070962.1 Unannotated [Lentimonas sp. CC11]
MLLKSVGLLGCVLFLNFKLLYDSVLGWIVLLLARGMFRECCYEK